MPGSWRDYPGLLKAAVVLHVLMFPALFLLPGYWLTTLAMVLLCHLLLCAAGLLPRCTLLGDNWNRLPERARVRREIAITIDDGPDPEVTPQVLDLLDRFGVSATFFCIATRAQEHADLCREMVRRGHALENHSYRHLLYFSCLPPAAMAREIELGAEVLQQITGQRPRFFRPPAGLRNFFLHPLLLSRGLRLASWTQRGYDTRESRPEKVLARLERSLYPGAILLLHDGNAARTAAGQPVILQVLPSLLEHCRQAGLQAVTLPAVLAREQNDNLSVQP
jgi:peptidoglycan/xylan/chitin deacetylase (PgdA/CDA1 family)